MKKTVIAGLIVTMVAGIGLVLAGSDGTLGNGAPQAKLLGKLNIIGVKDAKNTNMDNDGGSTIFVPLSGKTKILLFEGDDFAVLDKNATDGAGSFQLPPPDLDPYLIGDPGSADTVSAYSVFVRPLGKPGGWATITTCAELLDSGFAGLLPGTFVKVLNRQEGSAYCSVEQVGADILTRESGQSKFTNVTAQLLTIVFRVEVLVEVEPGVFETQVVYVRVPIFDDIIQGEYWEYDNHGLKLCQVRFYDVPTDVVLSDGPYLPAE